LCADALIQSEVLLCDVAPSTQPGGEHENVTPGHTANADPTRREHATLWQVSRGAFDFRTPRLAVVVDAVVTTCTGDVILKLVVSDICSELRCVVLCCVVVWCQVIWYDPSLTVGHHRQFGCIYYRGCSSCNSAIPGVRRPGNHGGKGHFQFK